MSFLSNNNAIAEIDPWRTDNPEPINRSFTSLYVEEQDRIENLTQRIFGTSNSNIRSETSISPSPLTVSNQEDTILEDNLKKDITNNNEETAWIQQQGSSSTMANNTSNEIANDPQANIWSNSVILDRQNIVDNKLQLKINPQEQQISDNDLQDWMKSIRDTFTPLSSNIINIEEIPEREGLLFKHTNYNIIRLKRLLNEGSVVGASSESSMSVVRRYSDFVWLQEVLLKRYPFRLIPELPPKKIGSQNLDPIFLNKRRVGLTRFINFIVNHPILSKDDLLLTFLTVPTDISTWRRQTKENYDTSDEFMDKKISISFMKLWSSNISEQWNDVASNITKIIDIWNKITIVIQRHEARLNQINQENVLLKSFITDLTHMTSILYPIENIANCDTLPEINNDLSVINHHIDEINILNTRTINDYSTDIVPKLKKFIDLLISLKNLFDRYKIMATNNIPQLQRHVQLNLEKLESMKGKPDVSGAEYDKIKASINRDRRAISKQINRAWLIRECILHEFTIFQESQFMISDLFKSWVKLNSSYSELSMNQWEKLSSQIDDIPIGRE